MLLTIFYVQFCSLQGMLYHKFSPGDYVDWFQIVTFGKNSDPFAGELSL